MKLIDVINGWKEAPECWRHFFVPPVRIRRESAIQEAPAVYSVQVLGVVLFIAMNRGMQA